MAYEFKGWSWEELAECWGIKLTPTPNVGKVVNLDGTDTGETFSLGDSPEMIDKTIYINNIRMTFQLKDEEEVLAHKLKLHIWDNVDMTEGEFKDKQMREDIRAFLYALAAEEDNHGYNSPVYRAMAGLQNDYTLANWVTDNLERLWS